MEDDCPMKKLAILAILTVFATSAFAQAEPGDLGVFFDPAGTTTSATPPAFTQNNIFYVATFGLTQLSGYEFMISISDPNIIIFNAAEQTNPGGSINVGTPPLEWTVGVGFCTGSEGVFNLVQVTYGFFVPTVADVLICLGPADPASLNPPVPAYLNCSGDILPFGVAQNGQGTYPDGCGVLYPTADDPIATDADSWGSLKAKF
jgi:hypothetical protein